MKTGLGKREISEPQWPITCNSEGCVYFPAVEVGGLLGTPGSSPEKAEPW